MRLPEGVSSFGMCWWGTCQVCDGGSGEEEEKGGGEKGEEGGWGIGGERQ